MKLTTPVHYRSSSDLQCRPAWVIAASPLALLLVTPEGVSVAQPGCTEAPTGPNTFHLADSCPDGL